LILNLLRLLLQRPLLFLQALGLFPQTALQFALFDIERALLFIEPLHFGLQRARVEFNARIGRRGVCRAGRGCPREDTRRDAGQQGPRGYGPGNAALDRRWINRFWSTHELTTLL